MGKKGGKKMPSAAQAKVINFFGNRQTNKHKSKFTQVKPIKKLTDEEMKASQKFINDGWERD